MNDDRTRPRPAEAPATYLSPTRAELVRYFAWGYLSRRELTEMLSRTTDDTHRSAA